MSADRGVERFVADPAHLSDVVRFDLPLLGDVSGVDGIHLQCHIGTDTLSLHRLGKPGTYVATEHEFVHTRELIWHHGLGEIVQALIDAGIAITGLVEHQSIPWEARPGEMTRGSDGEHRLVSRPERLPLSYTLQGIK